MKNKNVFITNLNKSSYNNLAGQYCKDFFEEWEGKEYVDEFLSLVKGKKILDLGCGNGNFVNYATKKGYKVKGYDISENMIKLGKEKNPDLNIFLQDITALPKENQKYDGALYCFSFMHLTKQQAKNSLLTLCPNLKQNAIVGIMTCCGKGESFETSDCFKDNNLYFKFYTKSQITKLLESCGFEVNYIKSKFDKNANVNNEDLIIFATKK